MSQHDLDGNLVKSKLTRRELIERAASLGLAVPALSLLAGNAMPARSARAQGTTAAPGGTLTYGFWQPVTNLDPQGGTLQIEALINQNIQDRIVWKKPGDPTYYPGLAASWEVAPDFTSYTLKLRNDVKFHDGTPFNAEAVKFTFDRIIDPATQAGAALAALGPYDSSEVIDDYTVKVNFKQPNGSFLNMATTVWLSPQSPTAIAKWGPDYQDHLTGAGSMMMTEHVHDDHITVVRNPDYTWGPSIFNHTGPSILDSIVYRLLPEDATRLAALMAGEIDVIDRVGPEDLTSLQADSNYKTFSGAAGGAPWIMCLNTTKAPTSELAVRQAMMMTFDQAAIVDLLFKGTLTPAYNLLEPTMVGYDETTKDLFKVDVEGAKQLLEDNGWTGDGIRSKDGNPLAVDLYIVADFGMDDMSAAVQSQMQAIGLDIKITSLAFPAWWEAINAGADAPHTANWTFYWWADPSGPFTAFFSEAGLGIGNGSNYTNPDVEKLLSDALATGDDTQRADFYNQAVRKVIADVGGLPAFHKRLVLAAKASVDMDNLQTNAEGYPNFYDVGFLS